MLSNSRCLIETHHRPAMLHRGLGHKGKRIGPRAQKKEVGLAMHGFKVVDFSGKNDDVFEAHVAELILQGAGEMRVVEGVVTPAHPNEAEMEFRIVLTKTAGPPVPTCSIRKNSAESASPSTWNSRSPRSPARST